MLSSVQTEEHKLLSHPEDSDLFHRDPGSEWVRWKQVSPQDAQVCVGIHVVYACLFLGVYLFIWVWCLLTLRH